MSVIPQAAIVAVAIIGGLVILCAIVGSIVFLVHRWRRRLPMANMQADLDMMPLEELEGRKTFNGRLCASSSLGSVVSQKE
ncbi:b7f2f63d-123b-4ef3-9845-0d10f93c5412 [Sclerotinia trifoliorum]|uniref:B7f2f63d-123b-4ef3-9845-0d10f93c5412 n=1 Tax=Sclerotinia trifoliorum TaxID=28548 RepID=A0A8H2ZY05_9HELO|nr:b7f2f63d-123b-4ef3-9845-0d10f93c5412 [Sclerotinia trifoliorum]